jgi:transposase-like protein
MRYGAAEKLEIIRLVEQSSLSVRRTLAQLGIPRSTFYAWYERYLARGAGALEDGQPALRRVWNKLPDTVAEAVLELALKEPALSPRELAVSFVDRQRLLCLGIIGLPALEGARPDHQSGLHPDEGGRQLRPSNQRPQSALANRLYLPAGDRLGLVLSVDRAR